MTPPTQKTTTKSIVLFKETLTGKNYSPQSIKAYMSDLHQLMEWLQKRRVDWDFPTRLQRIDIVEFINYLAAQKASAETRKRKLGVVPTLLSPAAVGLLYVNVAV